MLVYFYVSEKETPELAYPDWEHSPDYKRKAYYYDYVGYNPKTKQLDADPVYVRGGERTTVNTAFKHKTGKHFDELNSDEMKELLVAYNRMKTFNDKPVFLAYLEKLFIWTCRDLTKGVLESMDVINHYSFWLTKAQRRVHTPNPFFKYNIKLSFNLLPPKNQTSTKEADNEVFSEEKISEKTYVECKPVRSVTLDKKNTT